jgi:hypothetical protein
MKHHVMFKLSQQQRLVDANSWPTTCSVVKMRQFVMFKLSQQHTNNWETIELFLQAIFFPHFNVQPPKYGQIYDILFGDKCYNVTIGNFSSFFSIYFVRMFLISLGGHLPWMQCKHMYHIL